jgi:hypothetical protein
MNDPSADRIIATRLKYDWVVLLYGFFCVLIQLIYQGEWTYFFVVLGAFIFVEIFEVSVYQKLQNGGEEYHMLSSQILDQETSFGFLVICMILDFVLILFTSFKFLVEIFKQNVS